MSFEIFENYFSIPLKNGLMKPKKVRGAGYKMVNMGELFRYSRIKHIEMDKVPLTDFEKDKYFLEEGDLLFARQSLVLEGAGQCSIFLKDNEPVCFESHIIRCRLKKNLINPLFLYYFFCSKSGKDVISAITEQGAGAAGIRGSDLAKILIPRISLKKQDEIAAILSSLDDKIEKNNETNQTLEEMAQALFKSWFVDFDPVKAKMTARANGGDDETVRLAAMTIISGKSVAELATFQTANPEGYADLAATADLFPESLTDSELGPIPHGWEVGTFGDEVTICGGSTPSTKNNVFWDNGAHYWTTPKDLSNATEKIILSTERKITDLGVKQISSGILPVDTVLLSSRAPVGYLAITKVPICINQGYIAMVCKRRLPYTYVLQWTNNVMSEIKSRASGTTFQEISKSNFRLIKILIPQSTIVQKYNFQVNEIYNTITSNIKEREQLKQTRDTLLPKLLSGEINLSQFRLSEVDV